MLQTSHAIALPIARATIIEPIISSHSTVAGRSESFLLNLIFVTSVEILLKFP